MVYIPDRSTPTAMRAGSTMRLFDIPHDRGAVQLFNCLKRGLLTAYTGTVVHDVSEIFASRLIDAGQKKRDMVISLLTNSPTWNIVECAILKSGGIHVPLPLTTATDRLDQVREMTRSNLIVTDSKAMVKRLSEEYGSKVTVVHAHDACGRNGISGRERSILQARKDEVSPDDTAIILFTSGSTSRPKGVMLTHRNILTAAEEFGRSDVFNGVTCSLSILPMSHSAARKVNYACQLRGITLCYAAPSESLLRNLQLFNAQHMAAVPQLLRMLKAEMEASPDSVVPLKKVTCGGAPLQERIWQWYEDRSVSIYEVYGLTETSSLLSYSTDDCRRPGCVGRLAVNVEVRSGEGGELEVRGSTVTRSYLNSDGLISAATDSNGWYPTGDLVTFDADGGLRVIGRVSRSYKSQRGNLVHMEEVERRLLSISGVDEAFVVKGSMDVLKAVLVLTERKSLAELRRHISRYNSSVPEDLRIMQFATLGIESLAFMTDQRGIKPNGRNFTTLFQGLDFHVP